ncbi:MAG TPA: metalloregulator ArsR/SmtB family transcription factor [Candidatus Dormibacteraeota bacterium]|jgi:ArsR family transcriptional regulator
MPRAAAGPAVRRRGTSLEIPVRADPDWADSTAEVLRALADRTRLSMVAALRSAEQPVCVCDFTVAYGLSQPTISHHMGKLRAVGLVDSRKQGIWIYYSLRTNLSPAVERLLEAVLREVPAARAR